ncbi:MAG: accessory factor UbiK family protein [Gammaproteobacteria bacterium]|nr:accessory factor UbiK family protein [Gammaproteobacteria bacterium]
MNGPKVLEELTRRIYDTLPAGVEQLQGDVKKNIRVTLEAALARMDLVSREEFDVQTAVLVRSREKLEALEKKVAELEQTLASPSKSPAPKPKARTRTRKKPHKES